MTPSMPGNNPSPCNHPAPTPILVRLSLDFLWFRLIVLTLADLASAYIISPIARPDLALQHLQYVPTPPVMENVFTLVLSIASSLAPEDPEIAFNLAAVLEACTLNMPLLDHCVTFLTGGRLEDALTYYKRSKDFGVERAALHIRNVRLSSSSHLMAPSSTSNTGKRQDFRQEDGRGRK